MTDQLTSYVYIPTYQWVFFNFELMKKLTKYNHYTGVYIITSTTIII